MREGDSSHNWPLILAAASGIAIFVASDEASAAPIDQVHETRVVEQIESYCASSWRNANIPRADWCDCSQEVLADLLQKISRKRLARAIQQPGSSERLHLKRAVWRITKRWVRRVRHQSLDNSDCPDRSNNLSDSDELTARLDAVRRAAEKLSPRQKKILDWHLSGDSVKAISKRLGLAPARVSDEKYRAIQKIRNSVNVS